MIEQTSEEKVKSEKKPKQTIINTTLVILEGKVYEQIYDPAKAQCEYVSWNAKLNEYVYQESVTDSLRKIKYVPICEESKWVKNGFIPLPSKPENYISFKHLVDEINKFTEKYLDIPEERRQLNTYAIILSYMTEKLHSIPYLRSVGMKGAGKSRFCDVYGNIAYKPINILLPNIGNIYRLQDTYHGVLVINEDISPIKGINDNKELFTLLCSGTERGHPVPRCVGDKNDVFPFDPFGLKILSSYKISNHGAYESRCLNTEMIGTTRKDIPVSLGVRFEKDSLKIRNMLLDFRLKTFNDDFETYSNQTMGFWLGVSNRTAQCLQPLSFLIAFDPEIKTFLLQVAEQKNVEDITRDSESFDGIVFLKYLEIVRTKQSIDVSIGEIKDSLLSKFPDIKPRGIASSLKGLGLNTERGYSGNKQVTNVLPNIERIEILVNTYLFPEERLDAITNYNNVVNGVKVETETNVETQPQQKLDVELSLHDKIQSLLTCIEMNDDGMTIEGLIGEGFDSAFLDNCLDQGVIIKNPNGKIVRG
jgi:hypothetical protein